MVVFNPFYVQHITDRKLYKTDIYTNELLKVEHPYNSHLGQGIEFYQPSQMLPICASS